ncbi:hypothetical protein [Endothiovibrio diazotrophicus]
MIFQPAIMALLLADGVGLVFLILAALFAVSVLRHWDLASGSARQLDLERRSYLVSTLLSFVFLTQLLSLLLFIFNADKMADLFVGAMCAVGSLNVDPWGFPALEARVALFFLAAVWLVMNHLDGKAYDYPLVKAKYALVLLILPLALAAAGLQLAYFLGLRADVITSCCGSLFGGGAATVSAEMAGFAPRPTMILFYGVMAATLASGAYHAWRGRGAALFGLLSAVAFVTSVVAMITFISLYIYEHPHHHCPFCVLKGEYHYLGYALYVPLFAATALGVGVGVTAPLARGESMRPILAGSGRRLGLIATLLFLLFTGLVSFVILDSNLILLGD